ncbi:MAG TPA: DPP IV N-terminal domain-containing protein, partial [Actinomycetes bacterium]|nr:DPP IV N-terminal domain-containing protein [Actinomycetes bacterium]
MADTTAATTASDSYPRVAARTLRFTRGAPRSFQPVPAGDRVLFLRSSDGTDPVGSLWSLDVSTGAETLVADARSVLGGGEERLSAAERSRRERSREGAGGIVAFATDEGATVAAFALSSRLWVAGLGGEPGVRELPAVGAVIDPRPDPSGGWVAYAADGGLHVVRTDGSETRTLAAPDKDPVRWGVAEFVAAEEMGRFRGYWWAPDGATVLAARVDDGPVPTWYIADPAHPANAPAEVRYPVAGSADAEVTLHLLGLDGSRTDVTWERSAFPYLVRAEWTAAAAVVQVMSRDQRRGLVLSVDPATGATSTLLEQHDDVWLDAVPGVPALLPDGRLVVTADEDGARRLVVDGRAVTGPELQVAAVLSVDETGVVLMGSDDPVRSQLWRWTDEGGVERLTGPDGHHTGSAAGGTVVVVSRRAAEPSAAASVRRAGAEPRPVRSFADVPSLRTDPQFLRVGAHDLAVGVVLPRGHVPGTPLPVLMDPYGGPHHREVEDVPERWLEAQWIADRGFAVVKADGRGTGGRGAAWDRAVRDELAQVTLDDQVEALHAVAELMPDLDLGRVGIRGWSYGGYLAALAVLRRPDVFHAAVAGAPVTDWRLYDT